MTVARVSFVPFAWIGIPDDGADVLPVEAFIAFSSFDVFKVAAYRSAAQKLFSLLLADMFLMNQWTYAVCFHLPYLGDTESLFEV